MKNRSLVLILILAFLASAAPAQRVRPARPRPAASTAAAAAKPQAVPYEIPVQVKTLSNGMQVIVLADRSVPLVTISIAVRNGSFTEPPELNGLSHLYEHMFLKTNHATALYRCQQSRTVNPAYFAANNCQAELALLPDIKTVDYQGEIGRAHV